MTRTDATAETPTGQRIHLTLEAAGLHANPDQYDSDIHSWRCSYPDLYGPCKCLAELVGELDALLGSSTEQAERLDHDDRDVSVSVWPAVEESSADDGPEAIVVQIDTGVRTRRLRVNINDAPVWDGDPQTDEHPGAWFDAQPHSEQRDQTDMSVDDRQPQAPQDVSDWSDQRRHNMTAATLRLNRTLHARDNVTAVQHALDDLRAALLPADGLPTAEQLETLLVAVQKLYGDTLHAIANNHQERNP